MQFIARAYCRTYTHTRVCVYLYIYIDIHIYTYIHIIRHIYKLFQLFKNSIETLKFCMVGPLYWNQYILYENLHIFGYCQDQDSYTLYTVAY